jgi:hypothetical protein
MTIDNNERKSQMANRNRKHKLTIYLSDDEKFILENKVKLSNHSSMSAYLRSLIIYGYVYDIDYQFLRDYSTELSKIGSLLNQIARRGNSTGNLYHEDIKEVKELMEKVWLTHESMLSKQPLTVR